ncbi:MAG TPA: hypothetical protein VNT53_01960, partial [Pseudolysinimonas sp.]|nr:hypothetical protein [Pseudolysinimonas sp.]
MDAESHLRTRLAAALELADLESVTLHGAGALNSLYPVSELATASVSTAALALADLRAALGHPVGEITVDRGLVDSWFGMALTPIGWSLPSPWDAIAGDYATVDGWVRLHTNAPHHRAAALRVLGGEGQREH